jgi:NADH-quinone oxidoreductase subunit J
VTISAVSFSILAAIALMTAIAMTASRNAVHAALFLVVNLGTIAVFFLVLNAPFLAVAQVAVYAGAIMVLFLFVIMLLGAERLGGEGEPGWQRPLAFVLAGALLVEGGYLLVERLGSLPQLGAVPVDSGPQVIGEMLFESYLLPFEITSVLLLVAMVGAIVLTHESKEKLK